MARHRCRPHGTCEWKPVRGSFREVCVKCRDVFPCRFSCGHHDCIETRITNGCPAMDDFKVRNASMVKWPIKGLPIPDLEVEAGDGY